MGVYDVTVDGTGSCSQYVRFSGSGTRRDVARHHPVQSADHHVDRRRRRPCSRRLLLSTKTSQQSDNVHVVFGTEAGVFRQSTKSYVISL